VSEGQQRPEPFIAGPNLSYRLIRLSVLSYLKLFNRLGWTGREHVPPSGGLLVVSNHNSFLDIPAIAAALPRHGSFVARQSLARSRFLGWVLRVTGAVLLKRGAADRAALREMGDHLEAEDAVVIFPEGTRSQDGKLGEFRGGALFIAKRAGVPVLPVGIEGSFEAWPRHAKRPGRGRIRVHFGPPIDPRAEGAEELLRAEIIRLSTGEGC